MIARIRHFLAWLVPAYGRWVRRNHDGGPAPFRGPDGPHW